MGCCFSTPSATHAPTAQIPHGNQALGSSRVAIIAAAQPAAATTSQTSADAVTADPSPARPQPLIRLPSPVRRSPRNISRHERPWTRRVLEQERIDFFDTRVTGQKEVWDALRLVGELLRQKNVADAEEILRAVGLTCPTGRVASGTTRGGSTTGTTRTVVGGIYDERGELYELPAWVVRDPDDIIEDEAARDATREKEGLESDEEENETGGNESDEQDLSAARAGPGTSPKQPTPVDGPVTTSLRADEKGKGRVADEGKPTRLRARLSHAEDQTVQDILVNIGSSTKVSILTQRIRDHLATTSGQTPRRLRIVYLGQAWDDGTKTIEQHGYREGTVVQVLILPVWES